MAKDIVKQDQREVTHSGAEQLVDAGNSLSPDIDIYVSEGGIALFVELAGVEKGGVKIDVDENKILTIRAENSHSIPTEAAIRQFRIGNYYRAFSLADEYDSDKVSAILEDGVLRVDVPRKEEAKPHRIEITA